MAPVVFLDIDGVLNSLMFFKRQCTAKAGFSQIDPSAVIYLNGLTDLTGVEIVLTSSWRLENNIDNMRRFFRRHGITARLADFTPEIGGSNGLDGANRALEIEQYVEEHGVETFVIIDDARGFPCRLQKHLVQCETMLGFTAGELFQAIHLFAAQRVPA